MAQKKVEAKKKVSNKLGRNSDGTFAKGNKESVGNNGGRPTEDMSFRHQMKIRASQEPELVQKVINNLIKIASDPDHPKCVEAAEKLIKLNGNYDPAESKSEVTGSLNTKVENSPFSQLTKEDLLKLLKRKK
ncbi:hypothetical protein IKF23_03495 [Candidatus Saccharibacteria bacterium]|nr:hypothetical protein [Candidatus Saccharibacteria bacterium]